MMTSRQLPAADRAALFTTQAYFTAAGTAYHLAPDCRALMSGRLLADWDCKEYPCEHIRPLQSALLCDALEQGRWPCPVCVPAELRAFPQTYETYGHRPVMGFTSHQAGLRRVCARCETHTPRSYHDPDDGQVVRWIEHSRLEWPCSTAAILRRSDTRYGTQERH